MSDLRPLSVSVASITRRSFAKKFVALSRILEFWSDIIGADFASMAEPIKLSYRKGKTKEDKPSVTLHIAASPADSAILHYQTDLIIARINQIFGDEWVSKIKFEPLNDTSHSGFTPEKPYKKNNNTLSVSAQNRLNQSLSDISDPELRIRLEKLGQGVLRKSLTD